MKIGEHTIERFLRTPRGRLNIPDFQRPYVWDRRAAESLLNDIKEVVKENRGHYFGSLLYEETENRLHDFDIVDGQQRVTTILLMIVAIYHILKDSGDQSKQRLAERIKRDYLIYESQTDDGRRSARLKLKSANRDSEFFENIFQRKIKNNPQTKDSHLYEVYSVFYNYFIGEVKADPDFNLGAYIDSLENFKIAEIKLDKTDDVQRIFESINTTGKALSEGDKIRNFILMVRDQVSLSAWREIETKLTEADITTKAKGYDFVSAFFNNYLMSKNHSHVVADETYDTFKIFYKRWQAGGLSLNDLFADIILCLGHYLFLVGEGRYVDYGPKIKIRNTHIIGLRRDSVIPFLMNVLGHHHKQMIDDDELEKTYLLTESYGVRLTLCKSQSRQTVNFFAGLHKKIIDMVAASESQDDESDYYGSYERIITGRYYQTYSHLLADETITDNRMPNREDLEYHLEHSRITAHMQRYVLSAIEDNQQSKESKLLREYIKNQNKSDLTIEHVMPKSVINQTDWQTELGPDWQSVHEKWLNSLANLTLVGYNSQYSNRSFATKKTITNGYNKSPLYLNRWIAQQECWDEATLKRRVAWLLDEIESIWPRPSL